MSLLSTGSWRIVAPSTAMLVTLVVGILSLRGNRAQPREDHVGGYRSIAARLVDERQLPVSSVILSLGLSADGRRSMQARFRACGAQTMPARRGVAGGGPSIPSEQLRVRHGVRRYPAAAPCFAQRSSSSR